MNLKRLYGNKNCSPLILKQDGGQEFLLFAYCEIPVVQHIRTAELFLFDYSNDSWGILNLFSAL